MYKKFLIVASKKDEAGIGITTQLSQFKSQDFKFYLREEEIILDENLDLDNFKLAKTYKILSVFEKK